MSKMLSYFCVSLVLLSATQLIADGGESRDFPGTCLVEELPIAYTQPVFKTPAAPFSPFTGKIIGRKVRVRANASLESQIVRELAKNELVLVIGEKDDFYAIEAPNDTKAYVFRSFVLDDVVEGNRVNVRLEPSTESAIIGHLRSGDKLHSKICSENPKWLEISTPPETKFYIAKEYLENVGGPELKGETDRKRTAAEQLLEANALLTRNEFNRPFEEINIELIGRNYRSLMNDYTDFPEHVQQAKAALAAAQDLYIQKKITYLEAKAMPIAQDEDVIVSETPPKQEELVQAPSTERMKFWETVEESLYLNLSVLQEYKTLEEHYQTQVATSTPISGVLESYTAGVQNKPGDFIVRDSKNLPVAYVYSTQVNLQPYVGKRVTLMGSSRPNNNFAFPAYYVHSVE